MTKAPTVAVWLYEFQGLRVRGFRVQGFVGLLFRVLRVQVELVVLSAASPYIVRLHFTPKPY